MYCSGESENFFQNGIKKKFIENWLKYGFVRKEISLKFHTFLYQGADSVCVYIYMCIILKYKYSQSAELYCTSLDTSIFILKYANKIIIFYSEESA